MESTSGAAGINFGGTNNFYDTWKKKERLIRPREAPAWRVYIPGRIITKDLDGDGFDEVIINQNSSSGTSIVR